MKRRIATALTALLLTGISSQASAQQAGEEAANRALDDVFVFLFNGPVYLSSRLPMLLASQSPGAGMDLEPFEFSVGTSLKSDIYGQFQDVTYGADFLKLNEKTPDVVPLPSLGFYGRMGVAKNIDAGLKFDFVPTLNHEYKDMAIEAGHWVAGADGRYRVLTARGARPEVLLRVGAAYSEGQMSLAKDQSERFEQSLDGFGTVGGKYEFTAGPKLEWSIFQVQADARARWRFGGLNPYVGFGVDISSGSITSSLDGAINVETDTLNGMTIPSELASRSDNDLSATLADEKPTKIALHPTLGVEFDMGNFHIALQGDMTLPMAQEATKQTPEVEEYLNNDEGFYYVRYREADGFRNPVFSASIGFKYDFK